MQTTKIKQSRILLIARLILILATAAVGAAVFFVMKNAGENQLITSLRSDLESIVALELATIEHGMEKTSTIATRPFLIRQIETVNAEPDNAAARAALQRGADSFLMTGPSAISMFDRAGREVAHAGHFVGNPEVSAPIQLHDEARLLYRGGYYLRSTKRVWHDGLMIGKVITEIPLPTLDRLFRSVGLRGETAELAMCAPAGEHGMHCFPSTLSHRALDLSTTTSSGMPLPMTYALRGESGAIVTRDYRHREVVAAYRPVGRLGLGMVLKIDSRELYAPIWRQLRYVLPLLGIVLAIALLSLRWLFTPLVAELVRSERETHEANERLRESEGQVRTLVESVNEGIVVISENGTIELFNPGAEKMFGHRGEDMLGRNVSMLMPEPFRSEHDEYLARYWRTGEAHVIGRPREVKACRRDGSLFNVELRVSLLERGGANRGFIGILQDISERKAIEAQMAHFANYDALTNLANRRLVQDRIEQAIAHARRAHDCFAILFIDLDKFKSVNDRLGHDIGDQLLRAVARRLSACLREEDTVGRQGGDEFIALLARLEQPEDAAAVAEKIVEALSAPFDIGAHALHISASIGIAIYPNDGADFETLIRHSDTAMYRAKQSQDRRFRFFDQASAGETEDDPGN